MRNLAQHMRKMPTAIGKRNPSQVRRSCPGWQMNLEVRPSALNKGEIVKNLLSKHSQVDFIFCAGDDQTDEDMFRSLRDAQQVDQDATFSCLVGCNKSETLADYFVSSPADIVNVLSVMNKAAPK
ncbi:unnamed protein product [Umbelopsis ramanniana]